MIYRLDGSHWERTKFRFCEDSVSILIEEVVEPWTRTFPGGLLGLWELSGEICVLASQIMSSECG